MTTITISPADTDTGELCFQAVAGACSAIGATVGTALDGLLAQLPADSAVALVVLPRQRPDRFFSAEQQQQLSVLMARWRAARDRDEELPPADYQQLEALVEAEIEAAGRRVAASAQPSD